MAEKIILEVDVAGLANDIQTARVALDSYRIALERSVEENGKFSKEATIAKAQFDAQNKAVKQLEGQLLRVTQAQQANNAILKDLVKQGYDPATKSVDQNRKVLNALTAEYNRASKEGREKLAPTIKQISDELKKQEGAIGDTRRNVGNYKEAITSAFGELKGFGGQIVAVGQNIGGAVNAFKAAEGGVKGFGAALATTGLPLIIMGVNALTEAFSKFKPVADAVEEATTAVAAAFNALISGGNISEAVNQSLELLEVMRDLEDTQRAFNIQSERYNNEIQRLIVVSKDRTKTEQQRLAALNAANELEGKLFAENTKRLDDELAKRKEVFIAKTRLTEQEFKLLTQGTSQQALELRARVEKNKQYSEEELNVIQDLIRERVRVEGESLILQERLINRTNQLQQELTKVRKEEGQKQVVDIKNIADEIIKEQERIEAVDERIAQRQADRYIKDFKDRQSALQQLELNNAMQLELQSQFNQSQEEIDKEFAESNFNTFKEYYDNKKKLYEEDAKNRQKADEQILAGERAKVQAASIAANSIINTIQLVGEAAGAGAKFQKAVAFAQVLVNQALAIANAVVGATSSGASTGPAAVVTTPTFIATLISSVLAVFGSVVTLFGKADVPSSPKFADGGEVTVGGKLHSEGGTKYVGEDGNRFEVERGEKIFVLNRKASRHIDALGGLNMAFGGRSWSDSPIRYAADGGMIQDGGFGIRQTSEQANTSAMLKQFAKSIVSEMPTPVVSVVEFERVQTDRNKSISVADL